MKIAGFGGQGVLLLGLGLAQCGMMEGRQVSWLPSYGPEMRGGTAHCHVNISEEEIGSPLVSRPTVLMSLNQPSMEKFEGQLVPGGLQIRNVSMIPAASKRTDIENLDVRASEIADKLGNPRAANMVMLGAYAGYTGMLQLETCLACAARDRQEEDARRAEPQGGRGPPSRPAALSSLFHAGISRGEVMSYKVYVDGQEGTTGLRIHEYLAKRGDVEGCASTPTSARTRPSARGC